MDRGGRDEDDDSAGSQVDPVRPPERNDGSPADENRRRPEEGPSDAQPWLLRAISVDDPDPPWIVDAAGQVGIYLGLAAVGLAVFGVVASSLRVQPAGNVAMVFALLLISVAMILGMAFQAYVSDLPRSSN